MAEYQPQVEQTPLEGLGDKIDTLLNTRLRSITQAIDLLRTPTWDDLKFPATGVNPPGLASDPTWDVNTPGWLFANAKTEVLHLVVQLPHNWVQGSELRPHVHWMKSAAGAGDVFWQLEYAWSEIGEVLSGYTTLTSSTVADGTPDDNAQDRHLITPLGAIDGGGKGMSDMILMKLSRIGGDAADTYGSNARLMEFDIHLQHSILSSFEEYTR